MNTLRRPVTGCLAYFRAVAQMQGDAALKAVLFALAVHADWKTGTAFPGIERLAREAGMHTRSVRRQVREAESLGVLRLKRGGGGTNRGRGVSNMWVLDLERMRALAYPDIPPGYGAQQKDPAAAPYPGHTPGYTAVNPSGVLGHSVPDTRTNEHAYSGDMPGEQTNENDPMNNHTTGGEREEADAVQLQTRGGGTDNAQAAVLDTLRRHGITNGVAQRLATTYTLDTIEAGIHWCSRHARHAANPAGMLVSILDDGTAAARTPEFLRMQAEEVARAAEQAKVAENQRRLVRIQGIARAVTLKVEADPELAPVWDKMHTTIGRAFGDVVSLAESGAVPDSVLFDDALTPNAVANAMYQAARRRLGMVSTE